MRTCALTFTLTLAGPGCTFGTSGGGGSAGVADEGTGTGGSTGDAVSTRGPTSAGPEPDGSADGSSGTPPADTGTIGPGTAGDAESGPATTGATAETTDDGTTGASPGCTSALLVTGDPDPTISGDAPFYERLLALGYEVTVVGNAESVASDADGHCLVLLSALGSASDVEDKFRDVAVPIVTWEYALYDNMRMVDPTDTSAWGIADPQDDVQIVDAAHPLAGGQDGTVAIFTGGGRIGWGVPAGDAEIVATLPGDPERATLFGFPAGATMADGFVAPARRVGWPHGQTRAMTTAQGVDLFEAAVLWAVQ